MSCLTFEMVNVQLLMCIPDGFCLGIQFQGTGAALSSPAALLVTAEGAGRVITAIFINKYHTCLQSIGHSLGSGYIVGPETGAKSSSVSKGITTRTGPKISSLEIRISLVQS